MATTTVYFGAKPTSIILQSSTQFNGTATTGAAALTQAIYTFAAQAGGGSLQLP